MDPSDHPADSYIAKVYWMFAGTFIGVAVLANLKDLLEYRLRLNKASKSQPDPARPQNFLLCAGATITAVFREAVYYAAPALSKKQGKWSEHMLRAVPGFTYWPPMGHILLIAANFVLLLSLVFYDFGLKSQRMWEMIAVRAGWMTLAQLPLVFLMAGKANIVGALTGSSYERLNWIHRNVARFMLMTGLIHIGYFLRSWDRYGYIVRKFKIDLHAQNGLGAFCVLVWLVISSFAPIRGWRYEIFFIQHVVSGIGFLVAIWLHVPETAHIYIWFPVALWAFDRVVRTTFLVYNSLSIFHPSQKSRSVIATKALFHPLPDRATRITIQNPPFSWKPGQHAYVSCHSLVPFQSHPFTITSLPSDGYLEFVVRAHTGSTHSFHTHACSLLPPNSDECKSVFIDGPYGRMRPLEQFDSVVLICGSTGASFIFPLLRDLVRRRHSGGTIVTRRIRLIWVVKGRGQIQWFSPALASAFELAGAAAGIEIEASIYATCDPDLTNPIPTPQQPRSDTLSEKNNIKASAVEVENPDGQQGCGPNGSCYCADIVDESDDDLDAIKPEKQRCCCNPPSSSSGSKERRQGSPPSTRESLSLPEIVSLMAGRPNIRPLIGKELDRARGESAVVVCGPAGMVGCTRAAVVSLSDERAVHKGTGAQGVYLHTEAFSW